MVDQIFALIENAKAVKILNQSNPQPRPHRDPFSTRFSWQCRPIQPKTDNQFQIRSTILSGEAHSCKLPLENLKPIHLRDMKVPMVHHGRYLVCQASVMPFPIVGVSTIIEDLNGDVEDVSLYNFSYKLDSAEWLNKGTILIIKEPCLRYGSSGKTPSIRVDSPSDVIFVDPTDLELLKKVGAKQWYVSTMSKDVVVIQKMANDCFSKGDFNGALMMYDRALRYNPELAVLYLNKSLTCLRTGAFYLAYNAAQIALDKGGDPEKAIYRMGMAAYGMREWEKAARYFVDVFKKFPSNTSASDQLKRAIARCNEQKTGIFNFKSMYFESKKENPDMDVSDYIGPIEIAYIPGRGRGIKASKDIQRGTLLAVSKAFASGYSKDYPGYLTAINMIRNEVVTAASVLQGIRAMENLQKNPQRAKEIYDLYAGDLRKEEIPEGVIDAALIQQISSLNLFGSDAKNFGVKTQMNELLGSDDSHLFVIPSYFNHSCLANAHRTLYGNVMVIHAATNIKKGEEIFLAYVPPLEEFSERTKKLNSWKFTCQCKLCKVDANDPNCKKRSQLLEEFTSYAETNKKFFPKNVIDKGEVVLEKVRKSYGKRNDFKIELIQMLYVLAPMYYCMGNNTKSIKYLEEAITLIDDELQFVLYKAQITVNLAHSYFSNGDYSKGHEAFRKAFELSLCTDMEHFELLFPEMAKTMKDLNLRLN